MSQMTSLFSIKYLYWAYYFHILLQIIDVRMVSRGRSKIDAIGYNQRKCIRKCSVQLAVFISNYSLFNVFIYYTECVYYSLHMPVCTQLFVCEVNARRVTHTLFIIWRPI